MLGRIIITKIWHISEWCILELLEMLRNLLSIFSKEHLWKNLFKPFCYIPWDSSSLCPDSPRRTYYHTSFHLISVSELTLKKACMCLSILTVQLKSVSFCYNALPVIVIHSTFSLVLLKYMISILFFTNINWPLSFKFLNNPWAKLLTLLVQLNAFGLLNLYSSWSLTSYCLEPIYRTLLQITKTGSSIHR